MSIDIAKYPMLGNLLSLPEVIASDTIVKNLDADCDINLRDLIMEVRKELGLEA